MVEFDPTQAPSPRESMFSELLFACYSDQIEKSDHSGYDLQFAAWLKLKNTQELPSLLVLEQKSFSGSKWYLIDSARVNNAKGVVLMSGKLHVKEHKIHELKLYLCHPSPDIIIEVEELLFNGQLMRKDYIDAFEAESA